MRALVLNHPIPVEAQVLFEAFDEAMHHLLIIADGNVYTIDAHALNPHPSLLCRLDTVPTSILVCKTSLNKEMLAIQISEQAIIVIDVETKKKWTLQLRLGADDCILPGGLIWSEHGGNSQDLVVVTTKGLELYKASGKKGTCRLSRSITVGISHFWYSSQCRMLLTAASGRPATKGAKASDGFALDGFFLNIEKSNMPSLELPPPDRVPRLELSSGVKNDGVNLVYVYGLLLALVQYTADGADYVTVYHVTKASMDKMTTLSLGYCPSQPLKISTHDNLVLFHDVSMKSTLIFDIMKVPRKSSASTTGLVDPIAKPLTVMYMWVSIEELESPAAINRYSVRAPLTDATIPSLHFIESLKFHGLAPGNQVLRWPAYSVPDMAEVDSSMEAYPLYSSVVFDVYTSGWAYDCENRVLWRIECNPMDTARLLLDPADKVTFLHRRGKQVVIGGEDSVACVSSKSEESMLALTSLARTMLEMLEKKTPDSKLAVFFRALNQPYWNEQQRLRGVLGAAASSSSTRFVVDTDVQEALKVPVVRAADAGSAGGAGAAGGGGGSGVGGIGGGKLPVSPSSDSLASLSSSASNQSQPAKRTTFRVLRRPMRESLITRPRRQESLLEVDTESTEPIESPVASQIFLPDISVIGLKVRNQMLVRQQEHNQQHQHQQHSEHAAPATTASLPPSQRESFAEGNTGHMTQIAFDHRPLTVRRDERGDLLLSQTDTLAYIWIPLLLSHHADFSYFADALTSYIASFAEYDLDVLSALNILHATLFFYLGRLHDLCNFLNHSFYTDSSELGLILLQFSGMLEDEMRSGDLSFLHTEALSKMSPTMYNHYLPSWHARLQQHGLSMLWRKQDKITTVKWLLTQARLQEAIDLCLPKNDRWDEILKPGSIPGSEFFLSAVNLLRQREARLDHTTRDYEDNAQVFYNLHYFLFVWDPKCITEKQINGASVLSSFSHFPGDAFSPEAEKDLRRIFGYAQ